MSITSPQPSDKECPKCGKQESTWQLWTSYDEAHEDFKYTCGACGHVWWIDGIDS